MTSKAISLEPDDGWAAARRAAADYRRSRLDPPARQVWADRWLRPVVAVVWLVTVLATVSAIFDQNSSHNELYLAGSAGVVVVIGLGLWWLAASRRYLLRGSSASIRTALPAGAWQDVQRQLNGKRPVDPTTVDILLELAYQQRRLLDGQAAFIALYVPLLLSQASNEHNLFAVVLAGAAAVALVAAGVSLVRTRHRRSTVISQLDPEGLVTS